ncbi:MaoC family dehydratase [Actinomyces vulturis]|uniref:MaoC family dehydratase n=1 Tax=Actinomyces vulturis TaxID=1857645 RepID=UPI00082CB19A|nr:MaoC family dehydratase [Actinomyces vulturis]
MVNPINTQLVGFCVSTLLASPSSSFPSSNFSFADDSLLARALTPMTWWLASLPHQQQAFEDNGWTWDGLIHRSTTITLTDSCKPSFSLQRSERAGWEIFTHRYCTPVDTERNVSITDLYARAQSWQGMTQICDEAAPKINPGHEKTQTPEMVADDANHGDQAASQYIATLTPSLLAQWSELSGDRNSIHRDPDAACVYLPGREGALVAHGSLLATLALAKDAQHAGHATSWRMTYLSMVPVSSSGATVGFLCSDKGATLIHNQHPVLRVTYRHTE